MVRGKRARLVEKKTILFRPSSYIKFFPMTAKETKSHPRQIGHIGNGYILQADTLKKSALSRKEYTSAFFVLRDRMANFSKRLMYGTKALELLNPRNRGVSNRISTAGCKVTLESPHSQPRPQLSFSFLKFARGKKTINWLKQISTPCKVYSGRTYKPMIECSITFRTCGNPAIVHAGIARNG
jgi:hypothetical protein